MIMDGTLCQGCGACVVAPNLMEPGHPVTCDECARAISKGEAIVFRPGAMVRRTAPALTMTRMVRSPLVRVLAEIERRIGLCTAARSTDETGAYAGLTLGAIAHELQSLQTFVLCMIGEEDRGAGVLPVPPAPTSMFTTHTVPADFKPTAQQRRLALERKLDIDRELQLFKACPHDRYTRKGPVRDWQRLFTRWLITVADNRIGGANG